MTWRWRYENADGLQTAGPQTEDFQNQSDAESWLGECWRELLDSGIEQVTLFEDDTPVYGPMSLRAEG